MGIPGKAANYALGVTNFGQVYSTVNFFGCCVAAAIYLVAYNRFKTSVVFNSCFLVVTGLVFLGIAVPTLSERYITNQLFFFPIVLWGAADSASGLHEGVKRLIVSVSFVALGIAVMAQQSTLYTLGLGG